MLAEDVNLTSPWCTCLNRAKCYVSNSGVSTSIVSIKNKAHYNFLPKSVRNHNKSKFGVPLIRCFNCNKRGYMSTACPFEHKRKKGSKLMTKSFLPVTSQKPTRVPDFRSPEDCIKGKIINYQKIPRYLSTIAENSEN